MGVIFARLKISGLDNKQEVEINFDKIKETLCEMKNLSSKYDFLFEQKKSGYVVIGLLCGNYFQLIPCPNYGNLIHFSRFYSFHASIYRHVLA